MLRGEAITQGIQVSVANWTIPGKLQQSFLPDCQCIWNERWSLRYSGVNERRSLVKDTAWVTANANSILAADAAMLGGRRMLQPAPGSRPRRSGGGRRATRRPYRFSATRS